MKISSKGRYAVRIMAELARNKNEFVSVNEMSEKQGITSKYLEQIFALLSKSNLVTSARGSAGGYKLAVEPEKCSIAEILKATGDLPELAPCLVKGGECPRVKSCDSIDYWDKLSKLIVDYLSDISIEDIVKKNKV